MSVDYFGNYFPDGAPDVAEGTGSYLTSLSRVKEYLGIASSVTTYDDKLTHLLSAATASIQRLCDAEFISATRTEYHNGNGTQYLTLNAMPVTAGPKIFLASTSIEITNTIATTYEGLVKVESGVMTLTRNGTDSTLTLSSYSTIALLAAAVTALGNGWTATADTEYTNFPASRIRDTQGIVDATGYGAGLELFANAPGRQRCNTDTGTVYLGYCLPFGFKNVAAYYTGGYTTIPDDLQLACSMLTADLYRQSARDTTIKSERLGDYSYTNHDLGGNATSALLSNPEILLLLTPFRRVHAL